MEVVLIRRAEATAIERALRGGEESAAAEPGEPESPLARAKRLNDAQAQSREQLEAVYTESLEAWRESQQVSEETRTRETNRGPVRTVIRKTQTGRSSHLRLAMRAAIYLGRLHGVGFAKEYAPASPTPAPAAAIPEAELAAEAWLAALPPEESQKMLDCAAASVASGQETKSP
jgi:hypothetical protein